VVSAGSYVVSALALVVVGASIGFTAYRLRQRLMPAWDGAPARLVESIVAVALVIWLGEILGTFGLFYAWIFVGASVLTAVLAKALLPAGGAVGPAPEGALAPAGGAVGPAPEGALATAGGGGSPAATGPAGPNAFALLVTVGVVGLVFAHWGLTTKDALDRGIFNFDSLWYHMPYATDMVQSHSVSGLHYTETVFTNWFYPQNSELLHATGILLTHRDTLSLFVNFGFLGLSFLAAWCIGRPYGRGHLTVVAAAIVLECHTLVVREPGAAKNDLVAAALLLAAVAILVNARRAHNPKVALPAAWPLAVAGLAVGLAVGTKSTAVAMAAALTLAVVALAPAGRRWAAFGWWFIPALLGGGYWYLRNLIVAGNPLPQATSIGPISLPHPERLQEGRPNFNIVHYATDTGIWRHYFEPGLHQAFGSLWPLVILATIAGGLLAVFRGQDKIVRWAGGVALFGLIAYVFTPLSAAGIDGAPVGFSINIRYVIPALLLGVVLLPLAIPRLDGWRQWAFLGALLVVLVVSDRSDAALRDPSRTFAIPLAFVLVLIPATLIWASSWPARATAPPPAGGAVGGPAPEDALATAGGGGSPAATGPAGRRRMSLVLSGFIALLVLILAFGYPLQRHYLDNRFDASSEVPGLNLDSAYQWARDKSHTRIGLAGTTAGFLSYGFYGTDLSNRVIYLGEKGPSGAFNAIPTCTAFRTAVNAADLDYLVTTPFLNFIHTGDPISSPEAAWLRGDRAAVPVHRDGPTTIWRLNGALDASACGPANAPLRQVPNTPIPG
jgi:4-amino-4-deoxy-L-arabinose transferase-like glycosyltransferase